MKFPTLTLTQRHVAVDVVHRSHCFSSPIVVHRHRRCRSCPVTRSRCHNHRLIHYSSLSRHHRRHQRRQQCRHRRHRRA